MFDNKEFFQIQSSQPSFICDDSFDNLAICKEDDVT